MPDPTPQARTERLAGEPARLPAAVVADVIAPGLTVSPKSWWALAITSIAVFMVTLANLVVTMAIPVLREDLHAALSGVQWTVNAYTLTFAVLLLTGAALGERFGRRRLLVIGRRVAALGSGPPGPLPNEPVTLSRRGR